MTDINELMASGDPMMSPIQSVGSGSMGPAPPVNTTPHNDPPPQHVMMQQMMQGQATVPEKNKKVKTDDLPADVKDAVVVATVAFAVLMPTIQSMLLEQSPTLQNKTALTLVNACLIAGGYYLAREQLLGMM